MALENGEPTSGREPLKARIFISYSRKDLTFADRLEAGLKTRGFDTAIDRSDIYALEDWWKRIETLIAQADNIVFVLSPDAVASDVCQKEVAFAASLNKRLAPVVHRRVDDRAVPEALARLNFIFFDDETRFDARLNQLAEALATDIHWVRKHTEFGEHARRWAAAGRPGPRGLLLRSPMLEEAERWIASRPEGAPPPTEAAQAFITESRKAASQRRNILSGGLGAGLLVALGLAGLAYWQRGIAIEQEKIAVEQRDKALLTQSRFLADLAKQQTAIGGATTAILFAIEALPDVAAGALRPYAPEAEFALDEAWHAVRERMILASQATLWSAAFSPDGNHIVTASEDGTARIWDAATGEPIGAVLKGHKGDVFSAAFSPDGNRIVTASGDGTARIWDAATGEPIGAPLTGHEKEVNSAAFSRDGKRIVTASMDGTARIWDAETGQPIGEPLNVRGIANGLAPDTRRRIIIDYAVVSAAFSPDGKRIVTASDDNTARLWDAATGEAIGAPFIGHDERVLSAAFSPDGKRIVTASLDGTARIWDAETGQQVGAPLTTSEEAASRTNDSHNRGNISVNHGMLSAAFSPDGKRIVTASADKTARLWDAETGEQIGTPLKGHDDAVNSAAFSPDGKRIVTSSRDGTVRLWNTDIDRPISLPLTGHEDAVNSAAFSSDGKQIVTASDDETARIWDAITGEPIGTPLRGHFLGVNSAAFSLDSKRVVTASEDETARIWDAVTDKPIGAPLIGHEGKVFSAAFSPDGKRIVTASGDGTARIWDAATGALIHLLAGHKGEVHSAVFSPDGKRIVTASADKTLRLWDSDTGKPIDQPLIGHTSVVTSAVFSPDGRRIVSTSFDMTARQWDAESGKPIGPPLIGHDRFVSGAAFSPDGKRIATVSEDDTVRLWDSATGIPISAPFKIDAVRLLGVAYSPNGKRIVVASTENTVRIWNVSRNTQDLLTAAKAYVPRCLTRVQRAAAFLDPEPPIWCIETGKWPYETDDWKAWLKYKRGGLRPPLPDTTEWQPWVAARKAE